MKPAAALHYNLCGYFTLFCISGMKGVTASRPINISTTPLAKETHSEQHIDHKKLRIVNLAKGEIWSKQSTVTAVAMVVTQASTNRSLKDFLGLQVFFFKFPRCDEAQRKLAISSHSQWVWRSVFLPCLVSYLGRRLNPSAMFKFCHPDSNWYLSLTPIFSAAAHNEDSNEKVNVSTDKNGWNAGWTKT